MLMKDQVAIVTGGASGIGRAICERFAGEGAKAVIVADMREEPLEGGETIMEALARSGCEARFVRTDVSKMDDLQAAIEAAQAFGGVTTMVNNAGVLRPTGFLDTTFDDYEKTMTVNGRGVFFGSQLAAKAMIANGCKGSIINMSSISGIRGSGADVSYSASKGAIRLMTYAMASALASHGIRVNAIHPGEITTAMSPPSGDGDTNWLPPLGHAGAPKDVAAAAVYLASEMSAYVTATSLLVDGGMINAFRNE